VTTSEQRDLLVALQESIDKAKQAHPIWVATSPDFGTAMPHGSCNAQVGSGVCGFPRHPDGSCSNTANPHPAPPNWKER
jgi:hypothetical protein